MACKVQGVILPVLLFLVCLSIWLVLSLLGLVSDSCLSLHRVMHIPHFLTQLVFRSVHSLIGIGIW